MVKSYVITKIIWYKQYDKRYNLILEINNNCKFFGFLDSIPFINDIIECNKNNIKHKKYEEYKFENAKLLLPNIEENQKLRLLELLDGVNYDEIFKIFEYGKDFWINIYKFIITTFSKYVKIL